MRRGRQAETGFFGGAVMPCRWPHDTSVPRGNVVFDDEKPSGFLLLRSAPHRGEAGAATRPSFIYPPLWITVCPDSCLGGTESRKFSSDPLAEDGQKQRILSRKNGEEHSFFLKAAGVSLSLKKVCHLPFVFFSVQGAGHIEKSAAGKKSCPGMVKNLSLRSHGFRQSFGRKTQPKLGVSCERPCTAAWNIQ